MLFFYIFYTGTVVPENVKQNIDNDALRIVSSMKLQSDYLSENTAPLIRTNRRKKVNIRFKCLHCDYLTFRKQNLVRHLRQKHEVGTSINIAINICTIVDQINYFRLENK